MSNFDLSYVRAEQAYRADRIRDRIGGRQHRGRRRWGRNRRKGLGVRDA